MNNAFPLLQLPSAFLTNILRTMATLDLISFSFVSNRTKSLVVPLNRRSPIFEIYVKKTINVAMCFGSSLIFELCQEYGNGPVPLRIADSIKVNYRKSVYKWRKEGYGVKDWINHMMTVTNQSKVSMIQFHETGARFQVNSLKKVLNGLDIQVLSFFAAFPISDLLDVVAAFPLKMLSIIHFRNPNPVAIHSVLAQNFDALEMFYMPNPTLNELVLMNSKFIKIFKAQLGIFKVLCSFLKLWKMGSNRRLECLMITFAFQDFDPTVVFKGIKHQVIPESTVRYFKRPAGVNCPEEMVGIAGGFDIQGNDGRKATIYVENGMCVIFFCSC